MLCHRRHDILVFHVLDDDEMTFPFAGTTRFEGMEELPHLLCDPRALRDGYLEALEEYLVEVRRGCTRLGIDYQLVRTSDYLDAVLSKFLHHRMADRTATGAIAGRLRRDSTHHTHDADDRTIENQGLDSHVIRVIA